MPLLHSHSTDSRGAPALQVGSFDSSPAFKASAGATELAAKQVMSAVPLLPGIPISLFPDDMGSD
jgi:hypothetical protein